MIKAIETTYKGHLFRSRLEARWAAFFDVIDWPWLYEPFDLKGYIPDFVLAFPFGNLLVEVKPETQVDALRQYVPKIHAGQWDGEALVVGASPFIEFPGWDLPCIGWASQKELGWSEALWFRCTKCGQLSFFHNLGSWHCPVNGCYDGDHYHGLVSTDEIKSLWGAAHAAVQWRPA